MRRSIFLFCIIRTLFAALYQKNEGPPEEYKRNGVTYYIMANYERYLAVWFHDDIECSITGVPSREELIKMIDSI